MTTTHPRAAASAQHKYRTLAKVFRRDWQTTPRRPISRRRVKQLLRRFGWTRQEVEALEAIGLLAPLGFLLVSRGVLTRRERS